MLCGGNLLSKVETQYSPTPTPMLSCSTFIPPPAYKRSIRKQPVLGEVGDSVGQNRQLKCQSPLKAMGRSGAAITALTSTALVRKTLQHRDANLTPSNQENQPQLENVANAPHVSVAANLASQGEVMERRRYYESWFKSTVFYIDASLSSEKHAIARVITKLGGVGAAAGATHKILSRKFRPSLAANVHAQWC